MIRKPHITQKDIAEKLNLSKVTVSKALRGYPDIPKQTSDRIKAVASELGYNPNYFARNLAAKKSNTIGLIVPKIAHSFFSSIIETMYNLAYKFNYEIILMVSQESNEKEMKHLNTLLSMRVDGLLVSVSQQSEGLQTYDKVNKIGLPLVFFDRVLDNAGFSTVVVDDFGGSYMAVEYMIKCGYRKISHFAGFQNVSIGKKRMSGFKTAMKENNLEINDKWIIESGYSIEDGYNSMMKLIMDDELPEVIFTVSFSVALGVFNAAKERGLRIPEDIDLISFGNSNVNDFIRPSITYIDQPADKLGQRSLEILLDEINHPEKRGENFSVIKTKIIQKETCIPKY